LANTYKVYRNGILVASPTASPYTDTGLTNGVSYSYRVSAVNAVGEGPQSNTVTATPVAAGSPITNLQSALNSTLSGSTLNCSGQTFNLSGAYLVIPTNVTLENAVLNWVGGAGAAQDGFVIFNNGSKINNVTTTGGPYAALRIWSGVNGAQIINCDISGGNVHGNNPGGGGEGNEAGGIKLGDSTNFVISTVNVYNNKGPGIWEDVSCAGGEIVSNFVYDNTYAGIMSEISAAGAHIHLNAVHDCGWGDSRDSFAGGILYSSTKGTNIEYNTVAWCPTGIIGISQAGRSTSVAGTSVTNNKVKVSAGRNEESNYAESGAPTDWGPFTGNTTASNSDLMAAGIPTSPEPGH